MSGNHAVEQRIEAATQAINAGKPVLLVRGIGQLQVAEVVIAAERASTQAIAWAVRHTSGLLCIALPTTRADELDLPAMARQNATAETPVFGVAVDAVEGIGTGISAADRARTARTVADPRSRPENFTRPGHIMTIRTSTRGTIEHSGSAEAAVDLCRIAGQQPAAVIATLLNDNGTLTQSVALENFARSHRIPLIEVRDIIHHRIHNGFGDATRTRQVSTRIVNVKGEDLQVLDFEDELTGAFHFVCIGARPSTAHKQVYVIVECARHDPLLPDCTCQRALRKRRDQIAADGGVIVYLRSGPLPTRRYSVTEQELEEGAVASILASLGLAAPEVDQWHRSSRRNCDHEPNVPMAGLGVDLKSTPVHC